MQPIFDLFLRSEIDIIPETTKKKEQNPNIPSPVIVSRGRKKHTVERTITRAMRSNSRTISAGEPINWDEVYC